MTLRTLPLSRLDRVLPPLVRDCALVAIVPIAADARWAAEVAWSVARAAAARPGTRRAVALVDLCLEAPALHAVKQLDPAPGIADAISADMPLNEVAHDMDGVNFVAAGSDIPDPVGVRQSPRWSRLRAGFRNEDALLMVYLPADRLEELGTPPDAVLAIAPGGVDLGSPEGRALLSARERGVELLGVVRERMTATHHGLGVRSAGHRVTSLLLTAVVLVAIGAVALLAKAKNVFHGAPAAVAPARSVAEPPAPMTSTPPLVMVRDSGVWTLQLAAYGAPERALAHVDRLAAAGLPGLVSPLTPDASGAVWYRVQTGPYLTRDAALSARAAFWREGLAARGEGKVLRAPYSLALLHPADAARLRSAGFTGVRWGEGGPILVGAFERPEQAVVAQAELEHNGIATTLLTRTDDTP